MYHDIPHVVTAHSLEPHRPWKAEQLGGGYRLSSWAERTAFEAADAVIAVSAGMRIDTLDSYRDLDPAKVHVVRNGIDTDEFSPDTGTDIVSGLGIDPAVPDRGLRRPDHPAEGPDPPGPGCRAPRSRHPAGAARRRPGHPGDRPADRRRVRVRAGRPRQRDLDRADAAPRVQVRQVLSHATVFACPSVYEPLGIVNLEAMACETAVVASAVGGIPEVVVDGETGYLVPYDPAKADDPAAVAEFEQGLAAKINELTRDRDKAAAFGRAGRQRCVDEFSWAKIAAETVDVYRTAIAAHQG